jgi:hypothetical protein
VVRRGNFDEKLPVVQIGLEKQEIIEREYCLNLYKSPVCQTLSKTCELSRNAAEQYALCSKASLIL